MAPEDFKKFFRQCPERYPEHLESRYPRILKTVLEKWESPYEQERYLNSLVVDVRGSRQGFPPEVMDELLFVSELYAKWRAERRRRADESKLKFISPSLVSEIEMTQQKRLTPEVARVLTRVAICCTRDDMQALELLEQAELTANQKDSDGKTPLMHAALAGSENLMLALIQAQANPHVQDISGNTALHWAVIKGRLRACEILLYFGGSPDVKNKAGASPLALASIRSDSALCQRMLDYNADVMSMDNEGNTPLHRAILANAQDCIWHLLMSGSPRDLRNKAGASAHLLSDSNPEIRSLFDRYRSQIMQEVMQERR